LSSSRACGVLAIQNMSAGVRLGAVKFWGGKVCSAVHWHIDFFSRPALGAGLVALRQTLVRRCHI